MHEKRHIKNCFYLMTFFDIFKNTVIHSPFRNSCEHRFSKDCCWCAMFTGRDFLSTLSYVYGRKNHTLFKSNPYHFHRAIDKTTTKKRPEREWKKRPNTRIFSSSSKVPVFQLFFFAALSPSFLTHNSGLIIKTHCVFCVCVEWKEPRKKNWMKWRKK